MSLRGLGAQRERQLRDGVAAELTPPFRRESSALSKRSRVEPDPSRRRTAQDVLLLTVITTILALPSFRWPLQSMDESILLVYGEQVGAGLVPHRDFFTVYGPAPFYLLAGLFSSLGSSLVVERVLGLSLHVTIALGCYAVGRSRGRSTAFVAGLLSLTLLFPLGTVAYAWLGALACLVWTIGLGRAATRFADVVVGLLSGLSASFRPELAVLALVVVLPLMWRTRRGRWVVPGFLLGMAPIAYLWVTAGGRMWQNILLGRVGVNGSLRLTDDSVRSAVILGVVLSVTGSLIWFAWSLRSRMALMQGLLAVGVLPQSLQRVDPEHALYTLCVTGPLVLIAATSGTPVSTSMRRRKRLIGSIGVALVAGMMATLLRSAEPVRFLVGGRSVFLETRDAAAFADTRRELLAHAGPGSTIFVGTTDLSRPSLARTTVYYLMPELRARAYFLELPPGVSERPGSGLVRDLRAADVLLLSRMPDGLADRLYPYVPPGSPEANAAVRAEFCQVAETGWGVIYEHHACP